MPHGCQLPELPLRIAAHVGRLCTMRAALLRARLEKSEMGASITPAAAGFYVDVTLTMRAHGAAVCSAAAAIGAEFEVLLIPS